MNKPAFLLSLFMVSAIPVFAADDVPFQSMQDEMDRSMSLLKIKGHEAPYFMAYTLKTIDVKGVSASFGAIDSRSNYKNRTLAVEVRVGSHDLDNTNSGRGSRTYMENPDVTVDDDYQALRHTLWLQTDEQYKAAVERLEAKKAQLLQNTIKDRPADFTKATPLTSVKPLVVSTFDRAKWHETVRKVSAIFKEYPKIDQSSVSFVLDSVNRWFINSEGTKVLDGRPEYALTISASARAADGATVSDGEVIIARSEADIPNEEELAKRVRAVADQLTRSAAAPVVEDYSGPILFEGPAAGEFFAQTLAKNLTNPIEPLIGSSMANLFRGNNPFKEKIGSRILPTFVSVIDDPLATEYKGSKLFGTLPIDHEGVRAEKVTLVDKGILKTFCSTRTPSRFVKVSNGHARSGAASPSNLFVVTDKASTLAELREKLRELGKDQGLKKVLIVRRLQNSMTKLTGGSFLTMLGGLTQGAGSITLNPASVVYEVDVATGKETPSRCTPFAGMGIRTLRDIVAMGDDSTAYPLVPAASRNGGDALSIIAPSFIVKEMDTEKTERSSEKPPILPNPYFEKQSAVKPAN